MHEIAGGLICYLRALDPMHVFETHGDADRKGTKAMSKKQSQKTTSKKLQAKAHAKAANQPGATNKSAAAKRARTTPVTAAAAATDPVTERRPAEGSGRRPAEGSESRLPPPGTVIQKLDRYGAIRCECAVEEAGIRYHGNLYRSLSGAAMAAAKDLGLTNKTQTGAHQAAEAG